MSDLRRLWAYGDDVRGRLIAALFLSVCASGAAIGLTATAAFLISKASLQPPILTLSVAIVAVRFFGISRGVARYAERLVGHNAAFGVLTSLRVAVYRQLERLAPSAVPLYRSGDVLSRFVNDVETSQELFLRVIPPYVTAVVLGVATSIFVAWLLPIAGLICGVGLLTAALVVPALAVTASRRAESSVAGERSALSAQTLQLLDALPELLVADTSQVEQVKVGAVATALRTTEDRLARGRGVGSGLAILILGATVLGCLVVGVDAVNNGRLDGVLLAVVVLTPLAAFDLTAPLPSAYQQWLTVKGSAQRTFEIIDSQPCVPEPASPAPVPTTPLVIDLENVDVLWPGATSPALHDVCVTFRSGQRTAIVGPSGSGKSTLAALLLGFLQPASGSVKWNGTDARQFSTDDIRTLIGLLTQDGYVFDSTIEENLRIAKRDATTEQLNHVLADARILDWVSQLPEGLKSSVGEHGTLMSGGQRQRLCLARLLLANFSITVFDEPGEHLDTETADALTADLIALTDDRTVVLITHRLTGLESVDQILVLDQGRVTESGTHQQLVALEGWYATNWHHETAFSSSR